MRFVSVLGAIGIGLAIGSAAILAPLMIGTASPGNAGSAVSSTAHWATQWGRQAIKTVSSLANSTPGSDTKTATLLTKSKTVSSAQEHALSTLDQDTKTIDYLAHSGSPGPAKVADARIVQTPWTTQITVANQVTVTTDATAPKKLTSSKPASDEQRQSLVRDLQAELKRVGCYEGEPNGQWGATSKKAMASFTERVNASLPFEQPDLILLTLVQGHKGRACGQDCPAGQGLADNGRCMPSSILAQTERAKQGEGIKRESFAAAAAVAATAFATNKAIGDTTAKPRAIQPPASSIASAWATTTLEAPRETGSIATAPVPAPVRVTRPQPPAQQTAAVVVAPAATPAKPQVLATTEAETPARPATNLPGRMAIGAPLPPVLEAAPVPAVKPARPATQLAATGGTAQSATPSSAEPVTTATAAATAESLSTPRAKRAIHTQPVVRVQPAPHVPSAPHVVKRAPEAVVVRRPPPPPRYPQPAYASNNYGINTSGSKSRRLVYEMFQRPDRN